MKKYILLFFATGCCLVACNSKNETQSDAATAATTTSTVSLPYTASYSTDFNSNVPDSELLTVLNSYKYWEEGDMKGLRATMSDSIYADMSSGAHYKGLSDSIIGIWGKYRDSLSSVKITMEVWLKNHSVKDSSNYINVWYKEIDTFKNGKVDSANYEDDNGMKDGKIIWLSSHKQKLKED